MNKRTHLTTRTRTIALFVLCAAVTMSAFANISYARFADDEQPQATIFTDKADYLPGEIVTMNGAGWEPGETVTLVIHEELDPQVRPDLTYTSVADAEGKIVNTQFSPSEYHRGVLFTLTASGGGSGRSAATAFTDANSTPNCGVSVSGPANNAKSVGDTINLIGQVTTPGSTPVTYQWYVGQGNNFPSNFSAIPSATSINYSFTATAADDNNRYVLVAKNSSPGFCTGTWTSGQTTITGNASTPFTLRINVQLPTSLAVAAASGSYGSTVSLSATLTSSATGVSGKSVSFTVNGANAGSGTTNASGVASVNYALPQSLNVGGYTIAASFAGDTTYLTSNGSNTLNVTKANPNVSVTGGSFPYDGQSHPATGSVTGVFNESLGTPSFTYSLGGTSAPVNAGTYGVTGSYGGNTNYNSGSNNLESITISKVNATINVTPYSATYDGQPHTATGTATGVGGVSLSGLDLSGTTHTAAGTYSDSWTFTDASGNYNDQGPTSVTDTINKAPVTATAGSGSTTYDGGTHSPSACVVTGPYTGSLVCANNPSSVGPAAGTTTITPDVSGDTLSNFDITSVNGSFTIDKRDATWATNNNSKTYGSGDPNPLTTGSGSNFVASDNVTASYSREGGETVAGGPYHITATLSPAGVLSNYNITNTGATFTINPADADCSSIAGYSVTFNGADHVATGVCKGVDGGTLSGLDLSGTTHKNAGDYPSDPWVFTDQTGGNYKNASGTVHDQIAKAQVTATAGSGHVTYDGDAHSPSDCAVTGAYTGGLMCVNDPASETNAGSYTINPVVSGTGGGTGGGGNVQQNFEITTVSGTLLIDKKQASASKNDGGGVYNGSAYNGSGSCSDGLTPVITYSGGSAPINVGTTSFTVTCGDGNVNYIDGTAVGSIVITKAPVTATAGGGSVTYDGLTHSPSACAVSGAYTGNLTCQNNPASIGPGVGTTTIIPVVSGTGLDNFDITSTDGSYTINKADADCSSIAGYSVTFDGNPHTATGMCKGVNGSPLSGLDLSGTTHTGAGTYNGDSWTFTDATGNYNNASGTVDDAIGKANATISVNGYTGTYDGNAHGATGTATGAGSENLTSLLHLGSSFTNAPGGTANWTFDGDANHNTASGSASIVINQKSLTITASSPADITYGDAAPTVTPSYNGFIMGEGAGNLSAQPTCGTSYAAGSNAGGYSTTCSGATATNYSISYVAGSFNVNKKALTVKADDKSKLFDGSPFTAFTVTYTGFVLGQNQSVLGGTLSFSGSAVGATAVGTYTITPGGLTSSNYAITPQNGTLTIGSWTASGFYQPVDMGGVLNTVKGGSTVPLKFELFAGTTEKTNVADVKSFVVNEVMCSNSSFIDDIELTTTGGTSLRYDLTGGQFIQNWQTPKTVSRCYQVIMTAKDGSTITALFKTK